MKRESQNGSALEIDTPAGAFPITKPRRLGPFRAADLFRPGMLFGFLRDLVGYPFLKRCLRGAGVLFLRFSHDASLPDLRLFRIPDAAIEPGHRPDVSSLTRHRKLLKGSAAKLLKANMSPIPRLAALNHTAVLTVAGEDATDFLHAQLSCDVLALPEHSFTLGAWHNPSGKVKALFRLLRADHGWLLTTTRESVAAIIADLNRFVLRDDVTLRDESARWGIYALIGDSSHWLEEEGVELGREPGQSTASGGFEWLRIGPELVHVLGPHDALSKLASRLPEATEDSALAVEVSLGLPSLPAGSSERFIPQMLNLDLLGAIAAGKGCYPGQEVIARTQNLGSVKRRTQRFSSTADAPPSPGSPIFDDSDQIVGEVLRVATTEDATELLAVVRLASVDSPLSLEPGSDSLLKRESLPYNHRLSLSSQASNGGTG